MVHVHVLFLLTEDLLFMCIEFCSVLFPALFNSALAALWPAYDWVFLCCLQHYRQSSGCQLHNHLPP